MNLKDIVEPVSGKPPRQSPGSRSKVSRGETWKSCKEDIYRVYMTEKNTLPKTMELFEREYGLKACTRTWKAKLKEWKFDKYLTDKEKNITVAKEEIRRKQRQETAVFHQDSLVSPGKLATFKRRKAKGTIEVVSPNAVTTQDLTYYTPPVERNVSTDRLLELGPLIETQAIGGTQQTHHPIPNKPIASDELQLLHRDAGLHGNHRRCSSTTMQILTNPPIHEAQRGPDPDKAVAMEALRSVEVSETTSETILGREKAREEALDGYEASRAMVRTLDNDSSLFLVACSAGIVKILVKGLAIEAKIAGTGNPIEIPLWRLSPAYGWCDSCQMVFGSEAKYYCRNCTTFHGDMALTYCVDCYNNGKCICLSKGHQLYLEHFHNTCYCKTAVTPGTPRACDVIDCGKRISGLCFHCCICNNDGFDICLQCAMGGRVCQDISHVLSPSVRPVDRPRKIATKTSPEVGPKTSNSFMP